MTISEANYMCQFGCEIVTGNPRIMLQHLVDNHDAESLAKWKLNPDLIKEYLYSLPTMEHSKTLKKVTNTPRRMKYLPIGHLPLPCHSGINNDISELATCYMTADNGGKLDKVSIPGPGNTNFE